MEHFSRSWGFNQVLNDELQENFRKWYPQFEIKKAANKEATDTENSEELALAI
jgi:hypothetical protein